MRRLEILRQRIRGGDRLRGRPGHRLMFMLLIVTFAVAVLGTGVLQPPGSEEASPSRQVEMESDDNQRAEGRPQPAGEAEWQQQVDSTWEHTQHKIELKQLQLRDRVNEEVALRAEEMAQRLAAVKKELSRDYVEELVKLQLLQLAGDTFSEQREQGLRELAGLKEEMDQELSRIQEEMQAELALYRLERLKAAERELEEYRARVIAEAERQLAWQRRRLSGVQS